MKNGELLEYKMPPPEPSGFVVTLNQMGYMVGQLDIYSKKFCELAAGSSDPVLEVGAAYGIATLKALKAGAKKVYANDLDKRHLSILKHQCEVALRTRLVLLPGAFPEDVKLPDNYFSAILISRVLHFFSGEKILETLNRCYQLLRKNGKIFVICDTVFMRNWHTFIPEYQKRVLNGAQWPGLIEDSEQYERARFQDRQKFVNLFDKKVMENVLTASGFIIEEISYINQEHYPEDMRGTGKESVGAIGVKRI